MIIAEIKIILFYILLVSTVIFEIKAYSNRLYYLIDIRNQTSGVGCGGFDDAALLTVKQKLAGTGAGTTKFVKSRTNVTYIEDFSFSTIGIRHVEEHDPMIGFQASLNNILFGENLESDETRTTVQNHETTDSMAMYPSGKVMRLASQESYIDFRKGTIDTRSVLDPLFRPYCKTVESVFLYRYNMGDFISRLNRAELFHNKTGVHLPRTEWLHRGHAYLNISNTDFMQTAVNAFFILLEGTVDDVLRLPSRYVLRSARTIAMMRIAREKLVATWKVVKGDQRPEEVNFLTLEYYRPLFKYVNGREMARLNLLNDKILAYLGTHAELDRHQVGVIASVYIRKNPEWSTAKYLNLMNNLLCGVPMKFMRQIHENVYLQLSHQIFYHIKACDPLQRRFYLAMMTRTQVLGKSNSWGARDVAKLGFLLSEVEGPDLSAITPDAIAGITPQVMMEMSARNLKYFTEPQIRYLGQKPLNIYTKKMNAYDDEQRILNNAKKADFVSYFVFWLGLAIKLLE